MHTYRSLENLIYPKSLFQKLLKQKAKLLKGRDGTRQVNKEEIENMVAHVVVNIAKNPMYKFIIMYILNIEQCQYNLYFLFLPYVLNSRCYVA